MLQATRRCSLHVMCPWVPGRPWHHVAQTQLPPRGRPCSCPCPVLPGPRASPSEGRGGRAAGLADRRMVSERPPRRWGPGLPEDGAQLPGVQQGRRPLPGDREPRVLSFLLK